MFCSQPGLSWRLSVDMNNATPLDSNMKGIQSIRLGKLDEFENSLVRW